MSESEQETEFETGPRFNKAILGRVFAVGLFIALGTAAVVQSMNGGSADPQLAANGQPNENDGSAEDKTKGIFEPIPKLKGAAQHTITKSAVALLKRGSATKPKLGNDSSSTKFSPAVAQSSNTNFKATTPKVGAPKIGVPTVRSFSTSPSTFAKPQAKAQERFAAQTNGIPLIGNKGGIGKQSAPFANSAFKANLNDNAIVGKLGTAAERLKNNAQKSAEELISQTQEKTAAVGNSFKNAAQSFKPAAEPFKPAPQSFKPVAEDPFGTRQSIQSKQTAFAPPKVQSTFNARPTTTPPIEKANFGAGAPPSLRPNTNFGVAQTSQTAQPKASQTFSPTNSIKPGAFAPPTAPNASFNTTQKLAPIVSNNSGFKANRQTPAIQQRTPIRPVAPTQRSTNPGFNNSGFNNQRQGIAQPTSRPATTPRTSPRDSFPPPNRETGDAAKSASSFPNNRSRTPIRPVSTNNSIRPSTRTSSTTNSTNGTTTNPLTKNVPGGREYEGLQAPALTVEKLSPTEIQVNQPADFQLVIKNVGRVAADDVQVFDQIPNGTQFLSASPEPTSNAGGNLRWDLAKLRPGQEKRIKIQLKPIRHGEIGSVAHVAFATKASMRTLVTRPVLKITHQCKAIHLIGDDVVFDILVENKGDGPATNVLIQEDVPQQLEFQDGSPGIEYEIGTLMPGQSRRLQLGLKAAKIGKLQNIMFASADGGLEARHELPMEIVAPNLVTKADGPTRRFLQRNVTHSFSVANNGTAAATNVELVARLPSGLRFVSADNQGRYDANAHSVYWSLAELARDIKASVEVKTTPVEVGSQPIKFESFADLEVRSSAIQPLNVEHLVDVFIDIDDVVDPIEVGSDTSYKVRVVNQGTKAATNVKLYIDFPNGLQPTSIDGSLKHQINGQRILFTPINSMSPGDEISVIVRAKGQSEGDHRVVVNMETDGRQTSISKEETTRVYSDR